MSSSDESPMRREMANQMQSMRKDLKARQKYFMTEFDMPLELVAAVTITLGFDLLNGLEHPQWDEDDEENV